jgi:hypothetical protein
MRRPRMLLLFASVVLLLADIAAAQNCDQQFGLDVAACSQALNNVELGPKERAEAQKLCIADARAAKEACKSGVNTCAANCESAHTAAVATCQSDNDPAQCLGELVCAGLLIQQRSICLAGATDTLAACENGCGLTQSATCIASCGTAYTSAVTAACDAAYDPQLLCTPLDTFCHQLVQAQRIACVTTVVHNQESSVVSAIDQAASTMLSCTNTCLAP